MLRLDAFNADGEAVTLNVLMGDGSDETLFHEGFIRRIRLSSSRQKCFVEEVVKDASAQLVFSILIWRYVSSKVHSIMKPVLVMNWEKLRKRWAHVEKVPLKPLR